MSTNDPASEMFYWRRSDGSTISCIEKIKVLSDNAREIREIIQDAFEDALLMGCDDAHVRQAFIDIITSLKNPYPSLQSGD